jgi:hypothetical protein
MDLFGGQISTIRPDLELARAGQAADTPPAADGTGDAPATTNEEVS